MKIARKKAENQITVGAKNIALYFENKIFQMFDSPPQIENS